MESLLRFPSTASTRVSTPSRIHQLHLQWAVTASFLASISCCTSTLSTIVMEMAVLEISPDRTSLAEVTPTGSTRSEGSVHRRVQTTVSGDGFAFMWTLLRLFPRLLYVGYASTCLCSKLETDANAKGVEGATSCQKSRDEAAMAVFLRTDRSPCEEPMGCDPNFKLHEKYETEPEPWDLPSLSVISN